MKSMPPENDHFVSSRKGNIVALLFALVLAGVVFFLINSNNVFFADVTGGVNPPLFTEKGDVGVFIKNKNILTIRSLKSITDIKSMSILLMFDVTGIHLTKQSINSMYPFSYAGSGDGQAEIVLQNLGDTSAGEDLLNIVLKDDEDITNIVVGEIMISFSDGVTEFLSVEFGQ